MRAAFPWRGYVNQLTYAVDLTHQVEDGFVAALADDLVHQRTFTQPVADYHRAVDAALASGETIAFGDEQDEAVTRDFLARFKQVLDDRRPWPEPRFRQEEPDTWPAMRDAPVLARIPLSVRQVQERLNRMFDTVTGGDGEVDVLILRLRTGQVVALAHKHASGPLGVDLVARTDPASTLAAFHELTGIETSPAP
ncbi:hypothetical protein [Amycolatopsis samaneae]|uniref:Uncharacterized protein n=1 Tax=Amycolatopsis samaneae TaxID=664691 RepID=A0ABW5GUJ4_9PSEU